jgi:polyhydroxyalkanoate synthesis repressor PhaR
MIRTIKRYKNRKLYDTGQVQYVTFEDIRKAIVEGDQVVATDHETGEDITLYVLSMILARGEIVKPTKSDSAYEKLVEVIRLYREPQEPQEQQEPQEPQESKAIS